MTRVNRELVVKALNEEPQTPNDIAKIVGHTQKTVQMILTQEALADKSIHIKKVGRYWIFWRLNSNLRRK